MVDLQSEMYKQCRVIMMKTRTDFFHANKIHGQTPGTVGKKHSLGEIGPENRPKAAGIDNDCREWTLNF